MRTFLPVWEHPFVGLLRLRGFFCGEATAVGVLMAMLPMLAVPIGAIALVLLYLTRKATVGIGVFLIAVPVLAWPLGYDYPKVIYSVALPVLVGVTHYFSIRGRAIEEPPEPEQADERVFPQG